MSHCYIAPGLFNYETQSVWYGVYGRRHLPRRSQIIVATLLQERCKKYLGSPGGSFRRVMDSSLYKELCLIVKSRRGYLTMRHNPCGAALTAGNIFPEEAKLFLQRHLRCVSQIIWARLGNASGGSWTHRYIGNCVSLLNRAGAI